MSSIDRRGLLKLAGSGVLAATSVAQTAEQPQTNSRKKYVILVLDGGGIRGALTARLIAGIEEEIQKAMPDKVNFLGRVDCFAGTSTGGLIALGLACGIEPKKLVDLYQKEADSIFRTYDSPTLSSNEKKYYAPVRSGLKSLEAALDAIHFFGGKISFKGLSAKGDKLFFVRYQNESLKAALASMLTEKWKDRKLSELPEGRRVVVTTFCLGNRNRNEDWRPILLHNFPPLPKEKDSSLESDSAAARETTILDAAMCTSAAPTYFPPYELEKFGYCADGGVFANSPGVAALSMAIRSGIPLEDIRIVSIGTGSVKHRMKIPPWNIADKATEGTRCGLLAWLWPVSHDGVPDTPLITAMFDAGAAADEIYCKGIVGANNYRRIQVPLDRDTDLDDKTKISPLVSLAEQYFKSSNSGWEPIKEWLLKNVCT